ncbi:hypothetical protein RN001_005524 [Aquatica leii]|uniref:PHD-type domain-containing protein n=1 Tax=Aquatica leii TaxID=1421715 RepID=A0AAN7P6N9_9COLE|nr:hypothetical protein RN001_005524 [Aquatica leii]
MPSNCNKCKNNITRLDNDKINCTNCEMMFHTRCVNLPDVNINKDIWKCENCVIKVKSKEPILDEILKELRLLKSEHAEVQKSLNLCYEKIEDCNLILKKQEQTLVEHLERIELLETNNSTLRKENLELKRQINDLEQYSRTNCVEISGVPEFKDENTMSVVQAAGTALGLNLDSYTIDTCHRLKKNFNNQPRNIIVKFVRRLDKEEFLRCRRIKRNLSNYMLDP